MIYFRIQLKWGQRVYSLATSLGNPSVFDLSHGAEEGMGGGGGGGGREGGGGGEGGNLSPS